MNSNEKQKLNHKKTKVSISKKRTIDENFAQIEENFLDHLNVDTFKNIVYVDINGSCEFSSIQEAINKVESFTTIKIKPGIYKESLLITKGFLDIESDDINNRAIIISNNNPTISIQGLSDKDSIRIANLLLTNRGIRQEKTTIEETDLTKQMIYKNSHIIENLEINYNLDTNIIEGVISENRGRLSIITCLSGMVMISNCDMTLAYLSTSTNFIIPGIYLENCVSFIESSTIKGNNEFLTIGILSYDSNFKLVNCTISNHRSGGILCHIRKSNLVDINKTKFNENTGCGIFIKGEGEVLITDNLIDKNYGNGIHILESRNMNIVGNIINDNLLNGGIFVNCEGIIMLNSIFKNKGCGIVTEANENKSFKAKIMKNTVSENYQHGIVIKGLNNNLTLFNNDKISYNNLAGIHVSDKAFPEIVENKIFENMNQGILIVSESSAKVEKNEIFKNIKANIAFGGFNTEKTEIVYNKIYGSRNEGIYIIKASGGKIERNEIYENNDGIITVSCKNPEIKYNNIYNNIRTGVLLSDRTSIILEANNIHDNQFLGLFIRDESGGRILNNDLNLNISQLYLSKNCKSLLSDIKKRNNILGRIDTDSKCCIY